ncbi:MAG: Glycoprotease family protein [candidate division TM6 bacterium GW2011_GWF2_37_49]|nr:MAG: Glycoprotease family protein [candidate division TM6 bacterium GW2011_GWF2_37_49]
MQSKFLSIHGSYNGLDISLFSDQNLLENVSKIDLRASSGLIQAIDSLLTKHKLNFKDLNFIAVDKGPGAFTSLRVTLATVNGIAFDKKIPLIGISGLEALVEQAVAENLDLIIGEISIAVALLNAYNNDVYFLISKINDSDGKFPSTGLRISCVDESAPSLRSDELRRAGRGACAPKPWRRSKLVEPFQRIHQLRNRFVILEQASQKIDLLLNKIKTDFENHKIFFCGQGMQLHEKLIRMSLCDQAIIFENVPSFASSKTIGLMAYECWQNKENIVDQIEPLYLKTQYFAIKK